MSEANKDKNSLDVKLLVVTEKKYGNKYNV